MLVNEYRPGEGIMPHEDGGAYAEVVATVSLGAGLCLDVLPKPESGDQKHGGREEEVQNGANEHTTTETSSTAAETSKENMLNLPTRIFQEPRSLLITTGPAYRELMHGIASVEVDEGLNGETVANWGLLSEEGRSMIEEHGGRNVRGIRVSLTYRDVIKVSTAASRVFGLGRR
jgi:alkylated DNA repair protein alkB family protein 6